MEEEKGLVGALGCLGERNCERKSGLNKIVIGGLEVRIVTCVRFEQNRGWWSGGWPSGARATWPETTWGGRSQVMKIMIKSQKWKTRGHYFDKLKISKTGTFWLHCCQSVAARVLSRQYGQANSSLLRFRYLHFTFKYKYINTNTQIQI